MTNLTCTGRLWQQQKIIFGGYRFLQTFPTIPTNTIFEDRTHGYDSGALQHQATLACRLFFAKNTTAGKQKNLMACKRKNILLCGSLHLWSCSTFFTDERIYNNRLKSLLSRALLWFQFKKPNPKIFYCHLQIEECVTLNVECLKINMNTRRKLSRTKHTCWYNADKSPSWLKFRSMMVIHERRHSWVNQL